MLFIFQLPRVLYEKTQRNRTTVTQAKDALYLGFDLSTQQLKGLVVNSELKLIHEAKVDFDADLSKYGIQKGVLTNPSEGEIFAPTAMFIDALELVLQRLEEVGLDFSKVKGISGAGMQHGTVFWSFDAENIMSRLDPGAPLADQLNGNNDGERSSAFSHPFSPNWQDHSTQSQCEAFDAELGGPAHLAEATGSSAHHRFSGPQIMRFRSKYHSAYGETSRISLVSSFFASLLLGKVAPIDISDVTGMNLWDIKNNQWHERLLALAAGDDGATGLREKLGPVAQDGGGSIGNISKYFVSRYGFPKDCEIIPFTGDNPATILALPLRPLDAIVSLGTSTTFLMSTSHYKPDPAYHFLNHPTDPGLYMFMLCYKNGGLAREHVRDAINASIGKKDGKSWDRFNEAALKAPPMLQDNESDPMRMGLYFPRPEIVPNLRAGLWRYEYSSSGDAGERGLIAVPGDDYDESDARAIIESQFLSCRLRSQGLVDSWPPKNPGEPRLPPQPRRIYLVGGGSVNPVIAQIAGEVLGSIDGVYRLDIGGNACALGAAYKAVWATHRQGKETFEEFIGQRWNENDFVKKVADGYKKGVFEKYGVGLKGFDDMEKTVLSQEAQGSGAAGDQTNERVS